MPESRRHHYLPEFYLRGFVSGELLWVFDRVARQFRKQSPKNTAAERDYYAYSDATAQMDRTSVEAALADIEGRAAPLIKALDAGRSIDPQDRAALAKFVALLWSRTPAFEADLLRIDQLISQSILELVARDPRPDGTPASIIVNGERAQGVAIGELLGQVERRKGLTRMPRPESLRLMFSSSDEVASAFVERPWTVLHAPPKKCFVTSDAPMILLPPQRQTPLPESYGLLTPGATSVITLTRNVCLAVGQEGGSLDHRTMAYDAVRRLNLLIAAGSHRLVISSEERLLSSLVRAAGLLSAG